MPSDIESNEIKRRKAPSNQWVQIRMSSPDVPFTIRGNLGVLLGEFTRWPQRNISNAIQMLGDAEEKDSVAQILNGAVDQCGNRIPTLPNRGQGAIRRVATL